MKRGAFRFPLQVFFLNGGGVVIDRTHRMYFFDNSKEGGKKLPVSEICAPFFLLCWKWQSIMKTDLPTQSSCYTGMNLDFLA